MLEPLIRASSNPGDLVVDPFLGSGTTAVVARQRGRAYLGIERDPRYLAMAERRLSIIGGRA
jgi:DNA modification methylase